MNKRIVDKSIAPPMDDWLRLCAKCHKKFDKNGKHKT